MKRIFLILPLIVLFQMVGMAQVDTMGKYPYLYYYNWPQAGIVHDDTVMCLVTIGIADIITQSDWEYWGSPSPMCEYAVRQHTDDTIEAIGLAVAWGTGIQNENYCTTVVLYDSAMNELDSVSRIYKVYPEVVRSDSSAHHFYFPGYIGDTLINYDSLGIDVTNLASTYVYFDYFKEPVFITGDFYIGVRPQIEAWYCGIFLKPVFMGEYHNAPYVFHSEYRVNANGVWYEPRGSRFVPILFVIQKLPCEPVDSVSVVLGADGCLTVDWEQPALQSSWTVRLTLPDGSEITQPTDTNHCEYCGLATNQRYTIHVRSRCDDINGYSWSDWGSGFSVGNAGITATEGPAFELNPNPASGTVTVSCEAMEGTLEVVDMQGRVVLTAPATQHTLDISRLAAGSYFVRLTTQDGSAVRHLQVE